MSNVNRDASPHDRLTRICADMARVCEEHPEGGDDVNYVLCLDSRVAKRGGMVHSYEDDTEAIVRLFSHLSALLQSQGKRLEIMTLDPSEPT